MTNASESNYSQSVSYNESESEQLTLFPLPTPTPTEPMTSAQAQAVEYPFPSLPNWFRKILIARGEALKTFKVFLLNGHPIGVECRFATRIPIEATCN
jgi:hypothetical protein